MLRPADWEPADAVVTIAQNLDPHALIFLCDCKTYGTIVLVYFVMDAKIVLITLYMPYYHFKNAQELK